MDTQKARQNRLRVEVYERNHTGRRTITLHNPELMNLINEQMITGGLGYEQIPHNKGLPKEYDTPEDLMWHLGQMDARVRERKDLSQRYMIRELAESVISADTRLTRLDVEGTLAYELIQAMQDANEALAGYATSIVGRADRAKSEKARLKAIEASDRTDELIKKIRSKFPSS